MKIAIKPIKKPKESLFLGKINCLTDPRIQIHGYKDTQIHIRTCIHVYPYP
jgi:hypothetical protein